MNMDWNEVAMQVAQSHYNSDLDIQRIFLLCPLAQSVEAPSSIVLLEVVDGSPETGILPVSFPANPSQDVPFPLTIIELSPREYELFCVHDDALSRHGWKIAHEIPRKSQLVS